MQFVKVFAQLGDPKRAPYPVMVTQRVVNPRVAQHLIRAIPLEQV